MLSLGFVALASVSSITAAAAPDAGPKALIGGELDAADPAVAGIVSFDASGNVTQRCSGTLIAPRVVLTAAHCVAPDAGNVAFFVYFGSDMLASDPSFLGVLRATHVVMEPAWTHVPGEGNDIALLRLEADAPAAPIPLLANALSDASVGTALRYVGWGKSELASTAGSSGTKRQGSGQIDRLDAGQLYYDDAGVGLCHGDSGGPAFIVENGVEVVAAVSAFADSECNEVSGSTRVDAFVESLIDPFVGDDTSGDATPMTCLSTSFCAGECALSGVGVQFCEAACAQYECPDDDLDVAKSGGCNVAGGDVGDVGGVLLVIAAALCLRRRRAGHAE